MEEKICCIAKYVWDVPLIVAILSTGLYLSAASGFFSVRQLPGAIIEVAQDYWRNRTSGERQGGLRPYEVFFISLGTTVGFGSITGVALAVIIGGSGAIFWMWVSSLIGMVIKMAEVTLAAYYRNTEKKDQYYGSPMDYMEKGIGKAMNFAAWRIPVALFGAGFAATFIITLQDYEVVDTVRHAVGIDPWLVVTVYVLLTYLCIYKGIDGYRKIACWLVPSFLLFYVAGGILIIISNGERLLPCLVSIFQAAFDGQALLGGLAGRGLMEVVGQGLSISVFTTEAGWGTASMLYARADTRHPISLGRLGALEVFLVSMVICTTTALAIVVAGQQTVGISASELIIRTFATGMGALAPYFVAVMAFLFGLTTVVGWFLYYEVLIRYFSRRWKRNPDRGLKILKLIYPAPGILVVLYATQMGVTESVLWSLMAISTGVPAFINIFAVLILSSKFLELVKDYRSFQAGKEAKESMPRFHAEEETFYGMDRREKCEKSHRIAEFK